MGDLGMFPLFLYGYNNIPIFKLCLNLIGGVMIIAAFDYEY